jgi:hypothetical protein
MTDAADRLKDLWAMNARIGRSAEYAQMLEELDVWDRRALRAGLLNAGWFGVVGAFGCIMRPPPGSTLQNVFWVGLAGVILLSLRFIAVQVGRTQWVLQQTKRLMQEDRVSHPVGGRDVGP